MLNIHHSTFDQYRGWERIGDRHKIARITARSITEIDIE
jgi:hypothetical protein